MRYVMLGFCLFATACSGVAPTGPTSSSLSEMGAAAATEATSPFQSTSERGSALPFEGTYEGLETVLTVPSNHHLDATGNATHLGRFTVTADWTITAAGGIGTSTWTAANGDEISTSFTRSGVAAPPTITFTEHHTITSGTGRFANVSGTFTVLQTRGLAMPYNNSAMIDGTISLGH